MMRMPRPSAPVHAAGGATAAEPCILDRTRLVALADLLCCSKAVLLDELLPMFCEDGRCNLDRLRRAQAQRRWPDVRTAAHALGSGALDVGALRLGSLCRSLEALARQGGGEEGDALFGAIEACFAETCAALAAARP